MDTRWEQYKLSLVELYFGQRRSLEHIANYMLQAHSFHTTPAELQAQFKAWDVPKNLKRKHWEAIDYKHKKRKRNGKKSEVLVHGVRLPKDKVTKQVSQQGVFNAMEMYRGVQDSTSPLELTSRTNAYKRKVLNCHIGCLSEHQRNEALNHFKARIMNHLTRLGRILRYVTGLVLMVLKVSDNMTINWSTPRLTHAQIHCSFRSLLAVAIATNSIYFKTIVEAIVTDLNPITSGAATKWAEEILGNPQRTRIAVFPHYTETDDRFSSNTCKEKQPHLWMWHCHCEGRKLKFQVKWIRITESEKLYTRYFVMSNDGKSFRSFGYCVETGLNSRHSSRFLYGPRAFTWLYKPAILAARENDVETLQKLFSAGHATPWDRDAAMTLLIAHSAFAGAYDTTLLLIQQGSPVRDAFWERYNVLNPIWYGFFVRQDTSFTDGLERPAWVNQEFSKCMAMTQLILDQSNDPFDIEECDELLGDGGNLLHLCKSSSSVNMDQDTLSKWIRAMVRYGVDIEHRNKQGLTPLLEAAKSTNSCAMCIPILVKEGANVLAVDDQGRGAIHLSFVCSEIRPSLLFPAWYLRCYKFFMEYLGANLTALVAAGCDPQATDDQGKTPSEYIQNDSIWSMWMSVLAEAGKETRNEKRRPSHLPEDPDLFPVHMDAICDCDHDSDCDSDYETESDEENAYSKDCTDSGLQSIARRDAENPVRIAGPHSNLRLSPWQGDTTSFTQIGEGSISFHAALSDGQAPQNMMPMHLSKRDAESIFQVDQFPNNLSYRQGDDISPYIHMDDHFNAGNMPLLEGDAAEEGTSTWHTDENPAPFGDVDEYQRDFGMTQWPNDAVPYSQPGDGPGTSSAFPYEQQAVQADIPAWDADGNEYTFSSMFDWSMAEQ